MKNLGPVLPEPLLPLVDGHDLRAASGHTFLLLTAAEGDWPHTAMLSAGEVLAVDGSLRLALWPGSATTANLTENGRASLLCVVPPATYQLRLEARRLPDVSVTGRPRALFEAAIVEALEDTVAYANVTSGIHFELVDQAATLASWSAAAAAMRGESAS